MEGIEFRFWAMLFVFVLSTFVGLEVIRGVSRLLHTPLMSLTNAISAIAIVGSLIIAGEQKSDLATVLGTIAVAASMTNIVSGFLITDRMLRMFKKPEAGPAMIEHLTQAAYLAGTVLFILSLKWLSHPSTARRGVSAGAAGMGLAVFGTLLQPAHRRLHVDRDRARDRHRRSATRSRASRSPPSRSGPRSRTRSAASPRASSARPSTSCGSTRASSPRSAPARSCSRCCSAS